MDTNGPYRAIYGPYLAIYGHIWQRMAHIWPYMAHIWHIYDHIVRVGRNFALAKSRSDLHTSGRVESSLQEARRGPKKPPQGTTRPRIHQEHIYEFLTSWSGALQVLCADSAARPGLACKYEGK